MPKSPYMRGLALVALYLCFELAFGFLIYGRGRDDGIIARLVVVGGTLFGLTIYSQLARYVGLFLILAANSVTIYMITTDFIAEGFASIKSAQLLTFVIVGQTFFGIIAALYLLSSNFGKEFVKLRNDPSQQEIKIAPSVYRSVIGIALLAMGIATYRDVERIIDRLSAETQKSSSYDKIQK